MFVVKSNHFCFGLITYLLRNMDILASDQHDQWSFQTQITRKTVSAQTFGYIYSICPFLRIHPSYIFELMAGLQIKYCFHKNFEGNMYISYFNVYVATWNEIVMSCDQKINLERPHVTFESKALTLFDIRLVIVLSALELIDLMTIVTSSFELTLNLSYLFELRNFMKLSVKII